MDFGFSGGGGSSGSWSGATVSDGGFGVSLLGCEKPILPKSCFSDILSWTVEGGVEGGWKGGGGGRAHFRKKICNLNCLNISNPQFDTFLCKDDQP